MREKSIKRDILQASYESKACHIGSALSCVGILVDLFYNTLKPNDVFLFAKASGAAAYYAVLADKGYFSKEKLAEYLKNYPLASKEVPGVVHSVGSVGHGLPVAVGLALADRTRDVYCLISDGEVQEGTTYEAALFARKHKLDNLYVIVDANGLQACGEVKDILPIDTALTFLHRTFPHFKVEYTTKGDGVEFMENKYEWHYLNLSEAQLKEALCQI
jgi:transketolase